MLKQKGHTAEVTLGHVFCVVDAIISEKSGFFLLSESIGLGLFRISLRERESRDGVLKEVSSPCIAL